MSNSPDSKVGMPAHLVRTAAWGLCFKVGCSCWAVLLNPALRALAGAPVSEMRTLSVAAEP
jgi:hypothetical protein